MNSWCHWLCFHVGVNWTFLEPAVCTEQERPCGPGNGARWSPQWVPGPQQRQMLHLAEQGQQHMSVALLTLSWREKKIFPSAGIV